MEAASLNKYKLGRKPMPRPTVPMGNGKRKDPYQRKVKHKPNLTREFSLHNYD
jgi:hypothetical protein